MTFGVVDPRTGDEFARAPECSPTQLDAAFDAAAAAFASWRLDESARCAAMLAAADLIEAHTDELAALLAAESGKPVAMASGEVSISVAWLRYYGTVDV
ncbi:MAG TPA: aldehyde dehydrogenase family protein, partial [Ilumatobacter sp.]|nr:aldehyde dehydrogenase family protein [Ilumatobacter sp.]